MAQARQRTGANNVQYGLPGYVLPESESEPEVISELGPLGSAQQYAHDPVTRAALNLAGTSVTLTPIPVRSTRYRMTS
jgi:hypothetical protein